MGSNSNNNNNDSNNIENEIDIDKYIEFLLLKENKDENEGNKCFEFLMKYLYLYGDIIEPPLTIVQYESIFR